jgi:hypothetical protein
MEDEEDEEEDEVIRRYYDNQHSDTEKTHDQGDRSTRDQLGQHQQERGKYAWYNEQFPPLAMWVAGNDDLVDGRRLLRRFDRGREPHVNVVHKKIIEGYEHLDVIWAMDVIEKVGKEVKEVIWNTASEEARIQCRTPVGCEDNPSTADEEKLKGDREDNSYSQKSTLNGSVDDLGSVMPTRVDSTAGEWEEDFMLDRQEAKENAQEKD